MGVRAMAGPSYSGRWQSLPPRGGGDGNPNPNSNSNPSPNPNPTPDPTPIPNQVRSLPFQGQSETSRAYQPVLLQPTSSALPALGES